MDNSVIVDGQPVQVKQKKIEATTSGDTELLPATAGVLYVVLSVFFSVETACSISWKSGTTVRVPPMRHSAGVPIHANLFPGYFVRTNQNNALIINLSANSVVSGVFTYIELT